MHIHRAPRTSMSVGERDDMSQTTGKQAKNCVAEFSPKKGEKTASQIYPPYA